MKLFFLATFIIVSLIGMAFWTVFDLLTGNWFIPIIMLGAVTMVYLFDDTPFSGI